eukprot:TRINITY_DN36037_c0_g1_i1.p1 TRINITY_DN36037_c0_g1~~TRINITY_DN36037_c0_g1_i1.p1  ORF type:complete len:367 (+),score=35.22 TRINITY_DN36037_c0_g1_i1:255-1355(+)
MQSLPNLSYLFNRASCALLAAFASPARSFPPVAKVMHHSTSSSALLAANIYVSEGKNTSVISQITDKVTFRRSRSKSEESFPHCALASVVHLFKDESYNRTGITVCGPERSLREAVVALASAAFDLIDLRLHEGTHPRLGVVDHISVHPLGEASSLTEAGRAARMIGAEISSAKSVPVFLYGAPRPDLRRLADIRRELGYFRPSPTQASLPNGSSEQMLWQGTSPAHASPDMQFSVEQDFGPSQPHPILGCVAIGATPWVVNYNIVLVGTSIATAKRVARRVSERGGGLKGVEAMALSHEGERIEVACNLREPQTATPEDVLQMVKELCVLEGGSSEEIRLGNAYFPGLTEERALQTWEEAQKVIY